MLALLGISPQPPRFTYDSSGTIVYDPNTDLFALDATPLLFKETASSPDRVVFPSLLGIPDFKINVVVDGSGNLVSGVAGDDLRVTGSIDINGIPPADASGLLLTGEVLQFGYLENGSTDFYDFRFIATGGALLPYFSSGPFGVTVESIQLTGAAGFNGSFETPFRGGAKGLIGVLPPQVGGLSGTKFEDVDGDGSFDAGDPGVEGWTIYLDANNNGQLDSGESSTTTDADGNYSFSNLSPGSYIVREVGQTDWTQTTVNPGAVTVVAGTNTGGVNFGNFELGAIRGIKFNDLDGNGALDVGEGGLAGWVIELDQDADGDVDATDVTDAYGAYSFEGLLAGTYRIREQGQIGWMQTTVNPGDVTVVSGTTSENNNFGNFELGAISGIKFNDLNGDGVLEAGEGGLAGWIIELDKNADGTVDATATTIAGGAYSFVGLTAGNYRVREQGQSGWIQTTVNPGDVTVVSGTTSENNNFGNFQLGAIRGIKFNDLDGDGSLEAGEGGLAGWTIDLDRNADGTADATTVTVAGGAYSFEGLTAGTYRIREQGQAGWIQTTVNPGDVTVISGTNSNDNNFGNFQLGAIRGIKFNDLDGDGTLDVGEGGLAGWVIELDRNADGTADATTVTVAGGAYSFEGLTAGTYRIREQGQTGWIQTTVNPGDVAVVSGTNSTSNNFGNFKLGAIAGIKFNDLNGDGDQDVGENGLAGWTIELDQGADGTVDFTTATDASGDYSFINLVAGTYRIREVGQTDWLQTSVNPGDVTVISGTNSSGNNFGNRRVPGDVDIEKYVKIVQQSGGEGLTPGFWKTHSIYGPAPHKGWPETGFHPDDLYETVFGVNDTDGLTLLDALKRGGGGRNALGRHAVAALLNASHPNISYAFDPDSIIAWVQDAYDSGDFEALKNQFAEQNELGADLNTVGGNPTVAGPGSDADTPAQAVFAPVGSTVVFTYWVTNPGNVPLANVIVVDDNATTVGPEATDDDFNPTPTLSGGFNVGDLDQDNLLDVGEQWEYTASTIVVAGSFTNLGTVTANPKYTDGSTGEEVSDDDPANWTSEQTTSISGRKFKDITGNGLTADDTPLGGFTIQLYFDANKDGVMNDGGPIATTETASGTGAYSFDELAAGTYWVKEVVPTGWVRTAPTLSDFHKVAVAAGENVENKDFANYEKVCVPCSIIDVKYYIDGCWYTDLRGNTDEGDTITVKFTITSNTPVTVTLVSYTAPGATFDANTAHEQEIFDIATGTFTAGTYFLTVTNPNCYFQVDFVCGDAIDQFGPAGSNIFYTPQGRLISADNDGTRPCVDDPSSISGVVYVDKDNDGVQDAGESGIGGAKVTLTNGTTTYTQYTKADGSYKFDYLPAGDYTLREIQPSAYLDGKENAAKNPADNDKYFIELGENENAVGYNFGELKGSSVSGFVYLDKDNDGFIDAMDQAISGVKITLTGVDDLSNPVTLTEYTDDDGAYSFTNLRPGTYTVTETQPTSFNDGKDSVGSLGGSAATNDVISGIVVGQYQNGLNYNFGEQAKAGSSVHAGQTATIGFWNNKNGQALIKSFNGSYKSTKLGNWLASNFVHLFGYKSCYNLANKTNAQVAEYFQTLFDVRGQKAEAQVMATALAIYATDSDLGCDAAVKYGFEVTSSGVGAATFNVGTNGAAFGIANYSVRTVYELVSLTNQLSSGSSKYLYDGNAYLRGLANIVYTAINEAGDIG